MAPVNFKGNLRLEILYTLNQSSELPLQTFQWISHNRRNNRIIVQLPAAQCAMSYQELQIANRFYELGEAAKKTG
ncbi:unnamed protein product, partial [Nesidiocoris tenuis]